MKKPFIILVVVLGIVIVSYFSYDLLKGVISPCETIFQQTDLQLRTKIKRVKVEGETIIGKQKIQDLTESAQIVAERLKACCIVLHEGHLDAEQFLLCKSEGAKYEKQIDVALAQIKDAIKANKSGKPDAFLEKVRQINITIENAESTSRKLDERVTSLEKEASKELQKGDPDESNDIEPSSRPAKLRVSAILAEGGASPVSLFRIYRKGTDEFGEETLVEVDAAGDRAEYTFTLPAGPYIVKAWHGMARPGGKAK